MPAAPCEGWRQWSPLGLSRVLLDGADHSCVSAGCPRVLGLLAVDAGQEQSAERICRGGPTSIAVGTACFRVGRDLPGHRVPGEVYPEPWPVGTVPV